MRAALAIRLGPIIGRLDSNPSKNTTKNALRIVLIVHGGTLIDDFTTNIKQQAFTG